MNGDVIYFDSGPPSNFHVAPFWLQVPKEVDGLGFQIEFKGVEWWFQAYKVSLMFEPDRSLYRKIVDAPTAREAKRLGKTVPLAEETLRYWDGFVAVTAMLEGCLAKFWQDKECMAWLLNTGDAHLVEHRRDPVWGDNLDGTGKNQLGRILELVRTVIR